MPVVKGRDVVAQAQSGTGKTATLYAASVGKYYAVAYADMHMIVQLRLYPPVDRR